MSQALVGLLLRTADLRKFVSSKLLPALLAGVNFLLLLTQGVLSKQFSTTDTSVWKALDVGPSRSPHSITDTSL